MPYSNDYISTMQPATVADVGGDSTGLEMTKAFATAPVTLLLSPAVLRTAMFAGAGTYVASDPITAGAASFTTGAFTGNLTVSANVQTDVIQMNTPTKLAIQQNGAVEVANWNHATGLFTQNYAATITGNLTVGASTFVVTAATGLATSSGGVVINGSPTGYQAELKFGTTGAGDTLGISTFSTGSAVMVFDHRATSNTGLWRWRNGTGAATVCMELTAGGALAITGALTGVTTLNAAGLATFGDATGPAGATVYSSDSAVSYYEFSGRTTRHNWRIATQMNVNDTFEITPSTVAGGSTFSTPALSISASTLAATLGGALSITGALTGVTAFTSAGTWVNNATSGNLMYAAAMGANPAPIILANTSGGVTLGIEGSVASNLFTGTTAYATVFGNSVAKPVEFFANNALVLRLASGGVATIPNLAGVGTRTVVVDANGVLSAP